MKKIKVVPIKSDTLCAKCKYNIDGSLCNTPNMCRNCKMIKNGNDCICYLKKDGERCKHFERKEENNA